MIADLTIKGKKVHALMQAPKTGFFYEWDAASGKLLSAEKFAPVNWASAIDLKSGRPIENPEVRYTSAKAVIIQPASQGTHNWHPMSFSPKTGLVYIPVTESRAGIQGVAPDKFAPKERTVSIGAVMSSEKITALFAQPGAPERGNIRSYIEAWDPIAQKAVFKIPNKTYGASGTMVTAANLLFSGNHDGEFNAYDAVTGAKLWSAPTQARAVAAPMTYAIDGEQYVALLVGGRGLPDNAVRTSLSSANNSRLLVFRLGGAAALPTKTVGPASTTSKTLNPPLLTGNNEQVIDGEAAYGKYCGVCHGANVIADKTAPDLRYTTLLNSLSQWDDVVIGGTREANGMASFRNILPADGAENIFHYVISQANKDKAAEQAKAASR